MSERTLTSKTLAKFDQEAWFREVSRTKPNGGRYDTKGDGRRHKTGRSYAHIGALSHAYAAKNATKMKTQNKTTHQF